MIDCAIYQAHLPGKSDKRNIYPQSSASKPSVIDERRTEGKINMPDTVIWGAGYTRKIPCFVSSHLTSASLFLRKILFFKKNYFTTIASKFFEIPQYNKFYYNYDMSALLCELQIYEKIPTFNLFCFSSFPKSVRQPGLCHVTRVDNASPRLVATISTKLFALRSPHGCFVFVPF